jgi:hypothetical protein
MTGFLAVFVGANIIYINSFLRSFANGYEHNPATALSGATTFAASTISCKDGKYLKV